MDQPEKDQKNESREELIERLLAKAELDFKCCGSHCSSVLCHGEGAGGGATTDT
jgi:hypothetical protein